MVWVYRKCSCVSSFVSLRVYAKLPPLTELYGGNLHYDVASNKSGMTNFLRFKSQTAARWHNPKMAHKRACANRSRTIKVWQEYKNFQYSDDSTFAVCYHPSMFVKPNVAPRVGTPKGTPSLGYGVPPCPLHGETVFSAHTCTGTFWLPYNIPLTKFERFFDTLRTPRHQTL